MNFNPSSEAAQLKWAIMAGAAAFDKALVVHIKYYLTECLISIFMCHLNRPSCGWPVEMFAGKWHPVWRSVCPVFVGVLGRGRVIAPRPVLMVAYWSLSYLCCLRIRKTDVVMCTFQRIASSSAVVTNVQVSDQMVQLILCNCCVNIPGDI